MPSDKYLPSSEAFSKALAGYKPVSPHHAEILKSWRDHSDKGEQGELWRAVQSAYALQSAAVKQDKPLPPLPEPADFIGDVIGCAMPAKRLNKHSKYVAKRFEVLKEEIREVVKDADHPLDLWRDLQCFEKRLWDLHRSDFPTEQPAGGRNDLNNSRDRRLFAHHMFRYLKASCGEYLLTEVTMMVNIIFPTSKSTSDRTVREWLSEITPKPIV